MKAAVSTSTAVVFRSAFRAERGELRFSGVS